ncbi:uncharacterized protein LOC110441307 [Mizuhopecten yessoensis]|uniref:uncharacterized protein LOC110441307 n=1 Tax=Mizuhopecten yessoensis TaxID=6573 RepID=UPI000B45C227|nr:uncharacterized protein LOC110441307 [Mizuhopecten yessoensis]
MTIGSDDETAIRKASVLQPAIRFALKNNVKYYLGKQVSTTATERKTIVEIFFGVNDITASEDMDVLRYRVDNALAEWTKMPRFVEYFKRRLLPIIQDNVCVSEQTRQITKAWTNNNCESINHVLKVKTDWKQLKHVNAKYQYVKRALYNEGSFYLSECFVHHQVTPDVWFNKTEEERSSAFKRFMADKGRKPTNLLTSRDGSLTVPLKASKSKKINQIRRAERTTTPKRQRKA